MSEPVITAADLAAKRASQPEVDALIARVECNGSLDFAGTRFVGATRLLAVAKRPAPAKTAHNTQE
jgi:hypothetical protein